MLNKLGEELRNEEKIGRFKVGLRKWVIENIPIKPVTKFPKFDARIAPRITEPVERDRQYDIRRYLVDRSTVVIRPEVPPIPSDRPPPAVREGSILRYFRPISTYDHEAENEDYVNEVV